MPFPYWEDRFGWRSTGSRTDHVDGRSITTVFYADSSGRRIGYAILAGTPAPRVAGGGRPTAGSGIKASLLSSTSGNQVTYAGHPLYTYSGDSGPGKTSYVGAKTFGGT